MRDKLLMMRIVETFLVFTVVVGFTLQPVVHSQTIDTFESTERRKSSQSQSQSINNEDMGSKASATDHIPHQIGCSSPEILVNGAPSPDIVNTVSGGNFATIEEIQFVGVIDTMGQKRVCKFKCINGVWVGPLCALESNATH